MRDGTAEPVSRDQILRHARGQGNVHFPCSADHQQDWQPYPVNPYSAICDDHISYSDHFRNWATNITVCVGSYTDREVHDKCERRTQASRENRSYALLEGEERGYLRALRARSICRHPCLVLGRYRTVPHARNARWAHGFRAGSIGFRLINAQ